MKNKSKILINDKSIKLENGIKVVKKLQEINNSSKIQLEKYEFEKEAIDTINVSTKSSSNEIKLQLNIKKEELVKFKNYKIRQLQMMGKLMKNQYY